MDFDKQKKYRVMLEEGHSRNETEAWRYLEIHGRRGMVYPWNADILGVQVKAGKLGEKTRRAHKDWVVIQDADDLLVFKVPYKDLDEAAKIIHAYRKRHLSEEQKAKVAENFRKWRASNSQNLGKPSPEAHQTPRIDLNAKTV